MTEATRLREQICEFAKSLFDRGLTPGSSGNISAKLSDGSVLITPTGSAMGFLDPARISYVIWHLSRHPDKRPALLNDLSHAHGNRVVRKVKGFNLA